MKDVLMDFSAVLRYEILINRRVMAVLPQPGTRSQFRARNDVWSVPLHCKGRRTQRFWIVPQSDQKPPPCVKVAVKAGPFGLTKPGFQYVLDLYSYLYLYMELGVA